MSKRKQAIHKSKVGKWHVNKRDRIYNNFLKGILRKRNEKLQELKEEVDKGSITAQEYTKRQSRIIHKASVKEKHAWENANKLVRQKRV